MTSAQQPLPVLRERGFERRFWVARNPDPDSSLPFLVHLPVGHGLVLKAADSWPVASRVYCHRLAEMPDEPLEVLEEVAVRMCSWRGPAIDVVLDRARHNRSQFVFTKARGREAIFWQTASVTRRSRPGLRIPRGRANGQSHVVIEVDTREQRPYLFTGRSITTVRTALFAGDYAVRGPAGVVAAVERKTMKDFAQSMTSGALAFAIADLSPIPAAAVVVEERYSTLFTTHGARRHLAELTARLSARYPTVPIIFAENRKLAEEWTYRFLVAASDEYGSPTRPEP
jgi:hypothetical protein